MQKDDPHDNQCSQNLSFQDNCKFQNDRDFLHHPKLPDDPCYRLVICHGLFQFFEQNNRDILQLKNALKMLEGCYNKTNSDTNVIFLLDNHIEIYIMIFKNMKHGYVIVDKTGGVPPLICYPYPNSMYHGKLAKERAKGFRAAIDDIAIHQRDFLVNSFEESDSWETLNKKLSKKFHNKED